MRNPFTTLLIRAIAVAFVRQFDRLSSRIAIYSSKKIPRLNRGDKGPHGAVILNADSVVRFGVRALAAVGRVSAGHRRPVDRPDQASVPAGQASDYRHLVGRLGLDSERRGVVLTIPSKPVEIVS